MQVPALRQCESPAEPIAVLPIPQWKAKVHEQLAALARSPRAHRLLQALLLFGIPGIGAYAHLVEPTWLKVKRLTLRLPQLPFNLDGFRLVHLSDLHVGSAVPKWFLQQVVETVRQFAPDAIMLTGDFVHTRTEDPQELASLLSGLHAPQGTFAVLGNHDYAVNYPGHAGIPGVEEVVISALERAGLTPLRNEWVPVAGGRSPLAVMGVDELWTGRAQITPLEGIPSSYPRLLLCHNPDLVPYLPQDSFDLLLCGHTHGGQVRIPPFSPPLTATVNRRFWGGLFTWGRGFVFVNRGIGYTWRVRLASRPECVVITLRGR